jgi:tetratricopeptide (TPR) repeat protein
MFATGVPKLPGEILAEKARVALERRGAYKEAIELGRRALAYQRRNPEIYLHVGEANRRLAEQLHVPVLQKPFLKAAVAAYEAGLKIFPEDENLWLRLGQAFDGLKDFQRAGAAYQKAFDLDPKLWAVHALYANHLKLCGRQAEAEQELTIARELGKSDFAKAMESVSAAPRQNGIQPKQ